MSVGGVNENVNANVQKPNSISYDYHRPLFFRNGREILVKLVFLC